MKPFDVPIGTTAAELVTLLPRILRLDARDKLVFVRYRRRPGSKQRARARKTDRQRVAEWLKHDQLHPADFLQIAASSITSERLLHEARRAEMRGRMLSLCSFCRKRKRTTHIPLMDFRSDARTRPRHMLEYALESLGIAGVILRSGRSFHFYGFRLLTDKQWVRFVARCLLVGDFTDWRYVGHCLLREMCSLRIHGKRKLNLRQPKVVSTVNIKVKPHKHHQRDPTGT